MEQQKDNYAKKVINKKKQKPKYKTLNSKSWGINFDKNEYQEIILSNSNHPELMKD